MLRSAVVTKHPPDAQQNPDAVACNAPESPSPMQAHCQNIRSLSDRISSASLRPSRSLSAPNGSVPCAVSDSSGSPSESPSCVTTSQFAMTLRDVPPSQKTSPRLPSMTSVSEPPDTRSSPIPALMVSTPAPAQITSSPSVPLISFADLLRRKTKDGPSQSAKTRAVTDEAGVPWRHELSHPGDL